MNLTTAIGAALLVMTQLAAQDPLEGALVESFAGSMISPPPEALERDPFYCKYTYAFGVPIIASNVGHPPIVSELGTFCQGGTFDVLGGQLGIADIA